MCSARRLGNCRSPELRRTWWGGRPRPRGTPWSRSSNEESNACDVQKAAGDASRDCRTRSTGSAPRKARTPAKWLIALALGGSACQLFSLAASRRRLSGRVPGYSPDAYRTARRPGNRRGHPIQARHFSQEPLTAALLTPTLRSAPRRPAAPSAKSARPAAPPHRHLPD